MNHPKKISVDKNLIFIWESIVKSEVWFPNHTSHNFPNRFIVWQTFRLYSFSFFHILQPYNLYKFTSWKSGTRKPRAWRHREFWRWFPCYVATHAQYAFELLTLNVITSQTSLFFKDKVSICLTSYKRERNLADHVVICHVMTLVTRIRGEALKIPMLYNEWSLVYRFNSPRHLSNFTYAAKKSTRKGRAESTVQNTEPKDNTRNHVSFSPIALGAYYRGYYLFVWIKLP